MKITREALGGSDGTQRWSATTKGKRWLMEGKPPGLPSMN